MAPIPRLAGQAMLPMPRALAPSTPLGPAGLGRQQSSHRLCGSSPRRSLAEAIPSRFPRARGELRGAIWVSLGTVNPSFNPPSALKCCWPHWRVPVPPCATSVPTTGRAESGGRARLPLECQRPQRASPGICFSTLDCSPRCLKDGDIQDGTAGNCG